MNMLIELADRCEKATRPDRQLDAVIAVAVCDDPHAVVALPQFHGAGSVEGAMTFWNAPTYTASLDAAMALVPEGWGWALFDGAVVLTPDKGPQVMGDAATTPLALCATALRARSKQ